MKPTRNAPEILLSTPRFDVVRWVHCSPSGTEEDYYHLVKPDAVAIIPVKDNQILLLSQRRAVTGTHTLELPAGRIEAGEIPEEAALRELCEETGYRARKLNPFLTFEPLPSVTNERLHVFVADLPDHPSSKPEQGIEVAEFTFTEVLLLLKDSECISCPADAFALFRFLLSKPSKKRAL